MRSNYTYDPKRLDEIFINNPTLKESITYVEYQLNKHKFNENNEDTESDEKIVIPRTVDDDLSKIRSHDDVAAYFNITSFSLVMVSLILVTVLQTKLALSNFPIVSK